ncbi:hypothetical protein B0T16DRAFT_505053 [Cercophora newfieldiana]|uniref:Nephrocystin 3-like N-terminal domain-containing protein n=1 Tax=Cercophora newfieldiana TaxID=92897 RepID=A0AA40CV12_9PEZI|nr:hypothetical protein B0T16DRAFT_505053 [Cercophora newfieldiana]
MSTIWRGSKGMGDVVPQYRKLWQLEGFVEDPATESLTKARGANFEKYVRASSSLRIRDHVVAVYDTLFHILLAIVRVFTKTDGRFKKTPAVVLDLMWRPFESRFGDLIHQMERHKVELFREIVLWSCSEAVKDRQRGAAEKLALVEERRRNEEERLEASMERILSREDRKLLAADRQANTEAQNHTKTSLKAVHEKMGRWEKERLAKDVREWLSAPSFVDSYVRALGVHHEGTSEWFFDEPKFRSWLGRSIPQQDAPPHTFGTNVHGNPGAGKTVLASSIIDSLKSGYDGQGQGAFTGRVYYYFFEFHSVVGNRAISAYRSILSQILWVNQDNTNILDRFSFAMRSKSQGQRDAPESVLTDLLKICLDADDLIVVDGVDECVDGDVFHNTIADISKLSPGLRVLLLSRVNVARLNHSTLPEMRLALPKTSISRDICSAELANLFYSGTLPQSALGLSESLANRLTDGADGMFLWARLLMSFIRSPFLTTRQRLEVINSVNLPESLEEMYQRIFSLIVQAGQTSSQLASKVLFWLTFSIVPMSSRQIQHALAADRSAADNSELDPTSEFETTAVMACAGLVERRHIGGPDAHRSGTSGLFLIHQSLREYIERYTQQSLSMDHSASPSRILPDPQSARLQVVSCCLRQLLYHTDRRPLGGKLGVCVTVDELEDQSFYTAKNHTGAVGCYHPPLQMLQDWALSISTSRRHGYMISSSLVKSIRDLNKDWKEISKTWGDRLKVNPEIVWDEMTGIVKSRFFFSAGGTKVSFQDPQRPTCFGDVSSRRVTLMSRTSDDGGFKGVLSIWAPP